MASWLLLPAHAFTMASPQRVKLDELLMPVMGGSRLRMEMDRKNLWAGKDHVRFDQLAEYFARYLYLPRVVSREVLRAAVANGAEQLVMLGDQCQLPPTVVSRHPTALAAS